jgi:hypothetical protein
LADDGGNCIVRSFIIHILHKIVFRAIKSRRIRWMGCGAHKGVTKDA